MSTSGNIHTITTHLQHAFSMSWLGQRCEAINKIIDEASFRDLHSIYPEILKNVFGFGNQSGWDIMHLTRSGSYHFKEAREFLSPNGVLFNGIYRLLQDAYAVYEFPMSCIPLPSRQGIMEGAFPNLYTNKVKMISQFAEPTILLNSFELYFFYFSYHLLNPRLTKGVMWLNAAEALYAILLEDYLAYFLPLHGVNVPPMPHSALQSPVQNLHPRSPAKRYSQVRHFDTSSGHLLKSKYIAKQSDVSYNISSKEIMEQETWRSFTFLEILIEMWLNQANPENEIPNLNQNVMEKRRDFFMPSADHVRLIRMLVKHLHYFSNSALCKEYVSDSFNTAALFPMEEFKRIIVPKLLRKKLYSFLRYGFEKWPLDSSFKFLLETWLSFIQPWRYTDPPKPSDRFRNPNDMKVSVIDDKWQEFITENLLFYSVLLYKFLPRVFRMDLSSNKNAYLIYRVSKVFSMPNLSNLIGEIERKHLDIHPHRRLSGFQDIGASYLSPSNKSSKLNYHFSELETQAFIYQPIFCPNMMKNVRHLLDIICQTVKSLKFPNNSSDNGNGKSFVNLLVSFFNDTYIESNGDTELHKVEQYLEYSIENLCSIFQIELPKDPSNPILSTNILGSKKLSSLPEYLNGPEGPVLTSVGKAQVLNGLKHFDIVPYVDPELQPIRSFEIKFLVRLLHQIANLMNTKYGTQMEGLCSREDYLGAFFGLFLKSSDADLTESSNLGIVSPLSPRKHHFDSKSRIRLRWLGSYSFLFKSLIIYMVFSFVFGRGILQLTCIIFTMVLLYKLLKAYFIYKSKIRCTKKNKKAI